MDAWLRSGILVDLILVGTVVEAAVLWAHYRRTGRGVPLRQFGLNLLSGMALLGALRAALVGDTWVVICACLGLALVAHVSDLARRWVS